MKFILRVWKLIGMAPLRFVFAVAACTIWYLMPLGAGLLIRLFFDKLSFSASTEMSFLSITFLFFILRAGRGFWWLGTGSLCEYNLAVVAFLLRRNLFRYILFESDFSRSFSPGEFLNRFEQDAETLSHPVFFATIGIGQLLASGVSFWTLLNINASLTLIAFVIPLLSFLIMKSLEKLIQNSHDAARDASDQISRFVTDIFNNMLSFKTAATERDVLNKFDRLSEERKKTAVKSSLVGEGASALNEAVMGISIGFILLVVALKFRTLSTGDFALFASYTAFGDGVIGEIAQGIASMIQSLRRGGVSAKRLAEFFSPSEEQALYNTSYPHLNRLEERKDLEPSLFDREKPLEKLVLSDFDMRVISGKIKKRKISTNLVLKRGELVVITGRIGSGKTVLLQNILGMLGSEREGEGRILWNGRPVQRRDRWFVPPRCAYVPQNPRIFSDTLRENILLGWKASDESLEKALWDSVLADDLGQLDAGLDTIIGPRGKKLSGGQQMRTALARALVREPELLVLDDVSSSLDVVTGKKLWDRILLDDRKASCLVVSHNRSLLQRADRVVVLKEGAIIDQGPLDFLLKRCQEMQYLWAGEVE